MVKISYKEYKEAAAIVEKAGNQTLSLKLAAKAAQEQKKKEKGKEKALWSCSKCNDEVTITTQKVCDQCGGIDTVSRMD